MSISRQCWNDFDFRFKLPVYLRLSKNVRHKIILKMCMTQNILRQIAACLYFEAAYLITIIEAFAIDIGEITQLLSS